MTKKDYERLAKAIAWALDHRISYQEERYTIRAVAEEIALELERENWRFDRNKFMKACGF